MSKANQAHEKSAKPAEHAQRAKETAQHPQRTGAAPEGSQLARRESQGISPWAYSSPFSFMRRFSEEMDRLFDDFGFGGLGRDPWSGRALAPRGLGQAGWSPQVEMFEREGKLVVRADLPGMKREDIKVDLEDDAITIQGERLREHEENREGFYRSERSYGSFYRTIPLPEGVNGEDAKATFRDGVLEIEMEAPKRRSGRRIDVEEAPKAK